MPTRWIGGVSRFVSLYKWLDILRATPAVQGVGLDLPELPFLRRWAEVTKSLSPQALSKFIDAGDFSTILQGDDSAEAAKAELSDLLAWSSRVDDLCREASANLTAFPAAVRVIRRLNEMGVDVSAVSGTPEDHVIRHLRQYGIIDCFRAVFAQQAGKKHLALMTIMGYSDADTSRAPLLSAKPPLYDICAMFGDAPKDYEEAQKANEFLSGAIDKPISMYLIQVGRENESWQNFYDNILDRFVRGEWSKESEESLVSQGLQNLDRVWDPSVMPIDTFPKRGEKS